MVVSKAVSGQLSNADQIRDPGAGRITEGDRAQVEEIITSLTRPTIKIGDDKFHVSAACTVLPQQGRIHLEEAMETSL